MQQLGPAPQTDHSEGRPDLLHGTMTISISPDAFGSPLITWAGLSTLGGLLAGGALFTRNAARLGSGRRAAIAAATAASLGGIAGARLLHIVDYPEFYADAPFQAFYLWNGGLSLWGAVLGGLSAGLWRAWRSGLAPTETADAAALPGLVGLAVGWTGSVISGDPAGAATSLPWGIVYAHSASPAFADGAATHAVAVYEMLLTAAVALGVWTWGQRAPKGMRVPLALAAWGTGRFLIAFVRLDPAWLGLQQTQWIGLMALAATGLWALRSHRIRGNA